MSTRKTFNLSDKALAASERIREIDGYNETDTINRAIIMNAALLEYMESGVLTILSPDGEQIRLVLI